MDALALGARFALPSIRPIDQARLLPYDRAMERSAHSGTKRSRSVSWTALVAFAICSACGSSNKPTNEHDATTPPTRSADGGDRDAGGQDASVPHDGAKPASDDASASGGECPPNDDWPLESGANVFTCARCAPHGRCPGPDPDQGECECGEAYVGEHCERCADGFVALGNECITACEAAGVSCNGVCSGTADALSCECSIGYSGPNCSQCATGFRPLPVVDGGLSCVPTCDGGCSAGEMCTATSRTEQRCECVVGYERDSKGACKWQGLIADPKFEHGCASWHLFRGANPGGKVIAELAPGSARLRSITVATPRAPRAKRSCPSEGRSKTQRSRSWQREQLARTFTRASTK